MEYDVDRCRYSPHDTFSRNITVRDVTVGSYDTHSLIVGEGAGDDATGNYCVYVGYHAGYGGSTPTDNSGVGNTGVGSNSLLDNTSGNYNTAYGSASMQSNTEGAHNAVCGYSALSDNLTGGYNAVLGNGAGNQYAVNDNCVFLGASTQPSGNNASNQIVIGYNVTGNGDNTATIGNSSNTACYLVGCTYSDSAKVGDSSNYLEVKTNGDIELHGTACTVNDIWIDAGGIKAPGAKPATTIAHGTLETPAWQFADQAVAGNQETVSFSVRLPNRMDRSVAPYIAIGWSADGISPGNCEWQLEYLWTAANEDTSAAAQETLTATSAAGSTANGLVVVSLGNMQVPSSTDACLHCRITRLSAGGNDTIVDTVELHGVCFSFTSNKLGS